MPSPIGLCHQNNRLLQKFGEGEKEGTTEKGEILMHLVGFSVPAENSIDYTQQMPQ